LTRERKKASGRERLDWERESVRGHYGFIDGTGAKQALLLLPGRKRRRGRRRRKFYSKRGAGGGRRINWQSASD